MNINAPLIADRLFARAMHSEASRQEFIQRKAARIEQDIATAMLIDNAQSIDVAADMIGYMDDDTMAKVLRMALHGYPKDACDIVLGEMRASIKRLAEERAIQIVEAMTPEDFLPD